MTCIDFGAGLRSHIILQTITDQLPLASVLVFLFYLTVGKYKYIKTSSVTHDLVLRSRSDDLKITAQVIYQCLHLVHCKQKQ